MLINSVLYVTAIVVEERWKL